MTKAEKDNYWMDCIQQCRVSGMSDYAWCNQNGISISSFYYNVRRFLAISSIDAVICSIALACSVEPCANA